MVFVGDFRQVLPVVPKGTKAETIATSIVKSSLWSHIQILRLKQNMRSINDPQFGEFLLRVGDGVQPTIVDEIIKVPTSMAIPWNGEESIVRLLQEIYPDIRNHSFDAGYMVSRGIITPRNEDVDKLNKKIIQRFPRESRVYHSFDKVENDTQILYQQEFLNSISPGGMPPHALHLKVGAPIMLLRNLDPSSGLCNGTRLLLRWKVSIKVDKQQLGKLIVRELLRQQRHRNPIISDRASICSKDNMGIYVTINLQGSQIFLPQFYMHRMIQKLKAYKEMCNVVTRSMAKIASRQFEEIVERDV
ncbi:uncharacterized protein LOC114301074 [Camellia sinensis]|uniref:uncharacterized protein LOC114301074 n=1 Tax=Camellia sinensis TaxID=4442 RepID=UPI0010363AE1|nr:uncharacterized protein LOC114301074 [Camellia sinensis]